MFENDLKSNSNIINFIINDENSNQFAKQTDVILENFQKLRMTQILWKDSKISKRNIELIEWIEKNDQFVKNLIKILKNSRNR